MKSRLYFSLKPYLPRPLRMAVRRAVAVRQRKHSRNVWPINPDAGHVPPGWQGWPHGKRFALVLTHDVEGATGLAKCQDLVDLERSLGFRSSFNFIPEGGYSVPMTLRRQLEQNGFEVGVHDLYHDGKLYRSHERFSAAASRINRYLQEWGAHGFRSGFMLHNLNWLGELDVRYDSSTFDTDPFEPQADGANTIFPFWVPHGSSRGFVELPYTLPQDSTLFMVLKEPNIDIWCAKLDWIAARGGMALVNVHPDYLDIRTGSKPPGIAVRDHYEAFLQYIKQKYAGNYWHVLPREVAALIASRQNVLTS